MILHTLRQMKVEVVLLDKLLGATDMLLVAVGVSLVLAIPCLLPFGIETVPVF